MSQAFISYHRAQSKLARLIAHRVAADGHSVWWDRSDRPGDQWSEAVAAALANSACVVVIWSKQAVASPVILGEATAGYGRGALVSVQSDKTPPPSPFDKAPVIDMQAWEGESADLAWIRLRDPLRAKLREAEREAVENSPLPPPRPQPVRVGFSSTAFAPPPPTYTERKGSPAATLVTLMLLGGAGAGAWVYRDQLAGEAESLRLALTSASTAEAPAAVAPIPPPMPAVAEAPQPVVAEAPPAATDPPAEATAQPAVAAAPAKRGEPVPAMSVTYDEWRNDTYVPAPVMRTLPRTQAPPAPASRPAVATAPFEIPAPPPLSTAPRGPALVSLRQGQTFDFDPGGAQRADVWFAPDRTGYGLFLGVSNGARTGVVRTSKATPASCQNVVLRTTPLTARELEREGGLCVRSSDGAVSAWRVEGVERTEGGAVLRLRPVT